SGGPTRITPHHDLTWRPGAGGDTAEAAAGAVRLALLPDDGPSGQFFSSDGTGAPGERRNSPAWISDPGGQVSTMSRSRRVPQRNGLNDAVAFGSFNPHRLNPDRSQGRRGLIVKTGRGAEHRVGTLPGSIGRDHPRAYLRPRCGLQRTSMVGRHRHLSTVAISPRGP